MFIGPGDLEIDNWRPRVWYVASLIHMPTWVLSELCKLVLKFFWKGKRDLDARSVVVQPTCLGGPLLSSGSGVLFPSLLVGFLSCLIGLMPL